MSYDLLLTNSGDLSFIVSNSKYKNERLEFNFHVAPTDSLLFNFAIDNNYNMKNITFPDKNTKASRMTQSIATLDDVATIANPTAGMRFYVEDEQKTYEVLNVNEVQYLNEFGQTITVTKIGGIQPIEFSPGFNYNFYAYTLQNDKINRVVTDKAYIQQAIKIRLNTELNSIRGNEDVGADLYQFLHTNTQASRLLINISDKVKAAIADILPNCTVTAYIINSDYLNYHDSIKIVIVNNEDVYYYYV